MSTSTLYAATSPAVFPNTSIYEVPVIHQQNRIENIKQMLDSLEHLDRLSTNIFQRITNQVNEQKVVLNKLQQKTQVVNKAIEWVKNERKNDVIKVQSSATYPEKNLMTSDSKPLFNDRDRIHIENMQVNKYKPGPNNVLFNHKLYNPLDHFDKSVIRQTKKQIPIPTLHEKQGLSKYPPSNLKSVSELLCFNTNMNVYHEYHQADPLLGMNNGGIIESETILDTKQDLYIDPAPPSLSKNSVFDVMSGEEQQIKPFAPKLKELPKFDFPTNLALPNIVDTTQWDSNLDFMPSIAPSSLPTLDLGDNTTTTIPNNTVLENVPPAPSSIPTPNNTNVPPPPMNTNVPPPPVASGNVPPPPTNLGNVPPPPTNLAIPSPPPNVPAPPVVTSITNVPTPTVPSNAEETGGAVEPSGGGGGGVSDLLASIRSFSKNKLKKANRYRDKESSVKDDSKSKSSKSVQSSGGDMMSDLFRKISLRRDAIEGKKDEDDKPKKKKKNKTPSAPTPTTKEETKQEETTITPGNNPPPQLPSNNLPPPPKQPPKDEDGDEESDDDSW
ncbi:hypothetical protein ABK040_009508 [Willaertia magna]